MDPKERAAETLIHYFREVWRKAGLKWGSDNDQEVRGIVLDLLQAAKPLLAPKPAAAASTHPAAPQANPSRPVGVPVPPKAKGKL